MHAPLEMIVPILLNILLDVFFTGICYSSYQRFLCQWCIVSQILLQCSSSDLSAIQDSINVIYWTCREEVHKNVAFQIGIIIKVSPCTVGSVPDKGERSSRVWSLRCSLVTFAIPAHRVSIQFTWPPRNNLRFISAFTGILYELRYWKWIQN